MYLMYTYASGSRKPLFSPQSILIADMNSSPQQVATENFSAFLKEAGWDDADIVPMGADMGLRRYFLLKRGSEQVYLMDMSRSGYESGLRSFVAIADYLRAAGVVVPRIHHYDLESRLAVIDDLGEKSFGDAVKEGADKQALYRTATEVLVTIRQGGQGNVLDLKSYDQTLIRERLEQFVDFYMPSVLGRSVDATDHEEFQTMWREIEESMPEPMNGFCHADYHLENLIWRPEAEEKYGLIDFQDAFWGPVPYDLLNLLEDARQTVPDDIKGAMKNLYCDRMSAEKKESFEAWYDLLSAHFHCRVIGLFVKFPFENQTDEFLEHIPRLQGYIKAHLEKPLLAPLKRWTEEKGISFDLTPDLGHLA